MELNKKFGKHHNNTVDKECDYNAAAKPNKENLQINSFGYCVSGSKFGSKGNLI